MCAGGLTAKCVVFKRSNLAKFRILIYRSLAVTQFFRQKQNEGPPVRSLGIKVLTQQFHNHDRRWPH